MAGVRGPPHGAFTLTRKPVRKLVEQPMPTLFNRRAVVGGLVAATAAAAMPRAVAEDVAQGLRALADAKGIAFGSAVDGSRLKDPAYAEQLLRECNTLVP